ncbi:hypothetical protein DFH09DRAFT_1098633 [Mycena vulgaris]|nr:hypothetical protein DFH09DRAFT_1098633 [Mycena vulgaris]
MARPRNLHGGERNARMTDENEFTCGLLEALKLGEAIDRSYAAVDVRDAAPCAAPSRSAEDISSMGAEGRGVGTGGVREFTFTLDAFHHSTIRHRPSLVHYRAGFEPIRDLHRLSMLPPPLKFPALTQTSNSPIGHNSHSHAAHSFTQLIRLFLRVAFILHELQQHQAALRQQYFGDRGEFFSLFLMSFDRDCVHESCRHCGEPDTLRRVSWRFTLPLASTRVIATRSIALRPGLAALVHVFPASLLLHSAHRPPRILPLQIPPHALLRCADVPTAPAVQQALPHLPRERHSFLHATERVRFHAESPENARLAGAFFVSARGVAEEEPAEARLTDPTRAGLPRGLAVDAGVFEEIQIREVRNPPVWGLVRECGGTCLECGDRLANLSRSST